MNTARLYLMFTNSVLFHLNCLKIRHQENGIIFPRLYHKIYMTQLFLTEKTLPHYFFPTNFINNTLFPSVCFENQD